MSKRNWRWVSRDKGPRSRYVKIWKDEREPSLWDGGALIEFDGWDVGIRVCYDEFAACTGVKIEPGKAVKVQFGKAKVVK